MSICTLWWGEWINPGSQPVLMFPIVANSFQASISLISTEEGFISLTEDSGTYAGTNQAQGGFSGIELPGQGIQGFIQNQPIAGQLGNLGVQISHDGSGLATGVGTLNEVGAGIYSYQLSNTETINQPTWQSSNKGSIYVRIYPFDALSLSNQYIEETHIYCRLKPSTLMTVKVAPNDKGVLQALSQPDPQNPLIQLQNYFQQGLRDLLGNQMTTKPTFTRDR